MTAQDNDVQEAYMRGLHDGEVKSLRNDVEKAHERIDGHDSRLTALERVMYAGLGVVFLINILPQLAEVIAKNGG